MGFTFQNTDNSELKFSEQLWGITAVTLAILPAILEPTPNFASTSTSEVMLESNFLSPFILTFHVILHRYAENTEPRSSISGWIYHWKHWNFTLMYSFINIAHSGGVFLLLIFM